MATATAFAPLQLDGEITIYTAMELKKTILDALEECEQALHLDLSAVTELDTAGFQLLVLAKREAERRGKSLHIEAVSPATDELIRLYNMAGYFGHIFPASTQEVVPATGTQAATEEFA
jgi:anti-anti-sigma factor